MTVLSSLRSIPRGWVWVGVAAVLLLSEPAYHGMWRWWERRQARAHTEAVLYEVRFANERSSRPEDADVPMDQFTSEHVRRIVGFLDRARFSVCVGMYIVTVHDIGDALIRAKRRGVRVRVIGCESMSYSSGSQMCRLAEEDIPVRFNRKNTYLMHHKFCLIDTDWFCGRCCHAQRVERVGFCGCESGSDGGGGGGQQQRPGPAGLANGLPAGHAMVNGLVANGGGGGSGVNRVVPPCALDRGGCVRCDKAKRKEKERRALEPAPTGDPLPLGGIIVTGSTNWTMQALSGNWDNMIFTSQPELVEPFQCEFQRLWAEFARSPPVLVLGAGGAAGQ